MTTILTPTLSNPFGRTVLWTSVGTALPGWATLNPLTGVITGTHDGNVTTGHILKVTDGEHSCLSNAFSIGPALPFIDATMKLWVDFSDNSLVTYGVNPIATDITNKATHTVVDDFTGNPVNAFTVIPNARNGKQVGRFASGTFGMNSDGWQISDFISLTAWHIFVALRVISYPTASPTRNDIILSDNNSRWGLGLSATGGVYAHSHDGGNDITADTPIALDTWSVVEFIKSGGNISAVVNGVSVSIASGTLSASSIIHFGRNTANDRQLNADVGDIIAYNANPSAPNALITRDFLRNKWSAP